MKKKRRYRSESRITPKGGRRGCLCKDRKTYHPDCCTGEMHAQGIGNITGTPSSSSEESLATVTSEALTISGLSINSSGVITLPTASFAGTDFGTVGSVTPSSFDPVSTETTRTVTANVTVPAGYSNSGNIVTKNETATQPAAALTNPVQTTIHRYIHTGVPTGIVTYRMAINPDGTYADFSGIRGAVVGAQGFMGYSEPEVVSGSSTGLSFSATSIGGTQVGIGHHAGTNLNYYSATEFTSLQTGSSTNPILNIPMVTNNDGNTSSPSDFGFFDSTNSIGIRLVRGANQFDTSAPLYSQGDLNQAMPDGYYTQFNFNTQIRVQNGFITEVKNIV